MKTQLSPGSNSLKFCKEKGQENSEFERETENKRVQEEKNKKEREAVEKDERACEQRRTTV